MNATARPDRTFIEVFLYLQLLDLLTTMLGLQLGATEISPFIRLLMRVEPAAGVAASKLIAIALGGWCLWARRDRIVRWINYWYAGLVVWNVSMLLNAAARHG
ncbi:MAG TPA: DUF5658 family protein [Bryobacteraceae bacterium]|nr:DUF5658 family protein [Bryobacteraceae bacterium]